MTVFFIQGPGLYQIIKVGTRGKIYKKVGKMPRVPILYLLNNFLSKIINLIKNSHIFLLK